MKIHRLQFKNINNLKGEHEISFNELPLSTAGIFAIVGPTGSGKSTILDVITLALFNRIPRFKKAISKNEITNEGSVLTHHTTDASASIEYEIKGLIYKSTWAVSTNRNGKLRDYEMSIYLPDGSVADLKRSEVPAQNEKIIGLNYDQFIKSILLSQGEFSKFLKADKNDRGKLLEDITGTSIYRKIGIKAYEKYRTVKTTLDLENEKIGVISSLTEEERQHLDVQLNNSKKEKRKLDISFETLGKLKQIKIDLIGFKETLDEKLQEEIKINNEVIAFKETQIRLDIHQKLNPVRGPLATYNEAVTNAAKSEDNVKRYKTQLEEAKKKHQHTIEEMAILTKEKVNVDNFKKIMNDFETEINNADRDLLNLKDKGKEARERINERLTNYPIPIGESVKPKEAVKTLEERAVQLKEILAKAKLDSDKPIAKITAALKVKNEELHLLKEIQTHYAQLEENDSKQKKHSKELVQLKNDLKIKKPLFDKCKKLVVSLTENINLLNKQKEDAIKIAELEDFRNALVVDAPCPLCGSTEHPYAEHRPELHKSALDNKIKDAQTELQKQQKESEILSTQITQLDSSIKHTQKTFDELILDAKATAEEITKQSGTFKGGIKVDPKNIGKAIDELSKQNELTEQAIGSITELDVNKTLIQEFENLQKNIEKYQSLNQTRVEKFKGPDVNEVTNKLQDLFEGSKSKITELTVVIKKETESLKRDSSLVESTAADLNPKVKELGFSNIKEISNHLLDEATFEKLNKDRERLNKNKTKISTEIKTLKKDIDKKSKLDSKPDLLMTALEKSISQQKLSIENHQNIIITNQEKIKRDDEDKAKIQTKKKEISKLNVELEKWGLLNQMIGDATGNKFANFAQGLTLQNLLVYANRRLENLSDRYLLDKPENDGALIVIDKYQGSTSRSVTTLSGGESFLISLALALSLSDMASKNVALDCLFIDEGFGTLDPDSLESALTTLEKLQTESQKTVGVISHVEALKERIDVQIKLRKNAQGYSQIEVSNIHN